MVFNPGSEYISRHSKPLVRRPILVSVSRRILSSFVEGEAFHLPGVLSALSRFWSTSVIDAIKLIQGTFRKFVCRRKFLAQVGRRKSIKASHFQSWRNLYFAEKLATKHIIKSCYEEWREYTDEQKRVRLVSFKVFQNSVETGRLSMD